MDRVNLDRLRQLFGEMAQALAEVEGLSARLEEHLLADRYMLAALKYELVVAIQACTDICHHLVAGLRLRVPRDYGDCFHALADAGILGRDLAASLAGAVRLRNALVHRYWEVEDERVYRFAREETAMFGRFRESIGRRVGEEI